jgi:flagellar hook-length control protein FliK
LTPFAPTAATPTTVLATTTAATIHAAPITDQIAGQVASRVQGGSSHFEITLDPVGLGHVNVSVAINAAGQITAAMTFDNAHAAAEARSGAGALQQALEQAGFNLAQGGLSFDVGGQGANLSQQDARPQTAAASFPAPIDAPIETASPVAGAYGALRASSGVDITI